MRNNRALGSRYEQIAARLLSEAGYRILERNFSRSTGEIDLIAEDGLYLVFVEVKFRKTAGKGAPEAAVSHAKQAKIYRTAEYYMTERRVPPSRLCRFDVVAIEGEQARLIKNAFGGM